MPTTYLTRFPLGTVVITRAAAAHAEDHNFDFLNLLLLHSQGDWGELDDEDRMTNEIALRSGGRILSRYSAADEAWYVITEGDRSATTIMLVSDY